MHVLVELQELLAVVRAATELKQDGPEYCKQPTHVSMRIENGLLRVESQVQWTRMVAWLPVEDLSEDTSTVSVALVEAGRLDHLLAQQSRHSVEIVLTGHTLQVGRAGSLPLQFPQHIELYGDVEVHPIATVGTDLLGKILPLAIEFMSGSVDKECFGLHVEPSPDGRPYLRFCATNGCGLLVADLQEGVGHVADGSVMPDGLFVERPTIQAVLSCLSLWDGHPGDCELRVGHRSQLEPVVWFDLAGAGQRVAISTTQRGRFNNYRSVLYGSERPGVFLWADAQEINQLAKDAIVAGKQKRKGHGRVGFRFLYGQDGAPSVQVGYAVTMKGEEKETCQHHPLPSSKVAVVGQGLAEPRDSRESQQTNDYPSSYRVVTLDAKYLLAISRQRTGILTFKFHGCVDPIEVISTTGPDRLYHVLMPIRNGFGAEEL
jgi:hypothetical protein